MRSARTAASLGRVSRPKSWAAKAAEEIDSRDKSIRRLTEEKTGQAEAIKKYQASADAQRAKILLTDIKQGEVTRVEAATDTAFINLGSADYVRPMWQSIATTVIGRHLFDLTNGWEGRPPAGEHLVVVSPFRMHRFPVTNAQYELFDPAHADDRWAGEPHPAGEEAGDHPVVTVTWLETW